MLFNHLQIKFICLDVANGYSEVFVEYVRKVRKNYPEHTILVSVYISEAYMNYLINLKVYDLIYSFTLWTCRCSYPDMIFVKAAPK